MTPTPPPPREPRGGKPPRELDGDPNLGRSPKLDEAGVDAGLKEDAPRAMEELIVVFGEEGFPCLLLGSLNSDAEAGGF